MKQSFRRLLILLLGAIALSACASPAEMQNMVVARQPASSIASDSSFKNALAIAHVDGGETTNPLWISEVDSTSFQGALSMSLKQNDLLAETQPSSRFDLSATLASLNQPLFGLDMTVSSTVNYRVVERSTELIWFNDSIFASYTATFSDSPLGPQRLRLANEGSIRENIKEFIKRLFSTPPPTLGTNSSLIKTKPEKLSAEELLRDLNKLLDKGLITKGDYDHKKRQILKDM